MEIVDYCELLVTTRHLFDTGTVTYYCLTCCFECAQSYHYTYRPHSNIAIFTTSRTSGQLSHTSSPREQCCNANGPAAIESSKAC